MAKQPSQIEYEWVKKQTGVTSKFINEMWGQYYEAQGVDSEVDLVKKKIVAAGGTPKASNYLSEQWEHLLKLLGLRVSDSLIENRDTYFRNT